MDTHGERDSISAFVVCFNEEQKIRRCLESVKWCDEIIIVDSGSTDKTREVCSEYTSHIFQRPWPGYVAQKRFALEHCSKEWILNLDADEEVSPELRREILELLGTHQKIVNGYQISRVVNYLGRWWRRGGWYPEYRLRLCRRIATQWGGRDPHEKAIIEGESERLMGELFHYTYADITHQIRTLNNYSLQAAQSMASDGKATSYLKIFLNPLSRFFKFYFIRKGFLEGFPGLLVAILESYYVFLKYIKLWEINRNKP